MKGFEQTLTESDVSSHHISLTAGQKLRLFLRLQLYLLPFWDKMLVGIFLGFAATYAGILWPFLHAQFIDIAIPQKDMFFFVALLTYMLVFGHGWSPGFVSLVGNLMADLSRSAPGRHQPVDLGDARPTEGLNLVEQPPAAPEKRP